MKKLVLFACLLVSACTFCLGQVAISISGTVFDTGTGAGAPNYLLDMNIYDSTTTTLLFTTSFATDSMGDYNVTFTAANLPASAYGEIATVDCNGAILTLHFQIPATNTAYTNFDFTLCQALGSCNASFVATSAPGQTAVTFTDYSMTSSGTITQWIYTMGNGDSVFAQAPTYTYATAGIYTVCLTITTSTGCSNTTCMTVNAGGSQPFCQTTLSYGTLTSGAIGFWATTTSSGTPISFNFDFGDGNTLQSTQGQVPYTYPNGGIFTACVDVLFSDSCITSSSCTTVNAGSGPNCQADFYAIPDTTGQYSLLLVNNSVGNNLTYQWDFGDGNTSNQAYPQHTYSGPSVYNICLIVVDTPLTCTSTFCDSITVINKVNTPFTINVVPTGAVGVGHAVTHATAWTLFPNPANGLLNLQVELAKPTAVSMTLLDLHGRVVKSLAPSKFDAGMHATTLELAGLADGIYVARVHMGNVVEMRRIVVAH